MKKLALSAALLAGIAGGVAAISPAVYAQAQAPEPRRERPVTLPGERIDARIAYIKTALKITPAQERQWAAVEAVIRKHVTALDEQIRARQAQRDANAPRPDAIARLEQRQQMMTRAAAGLDEFVAAAKPLYASFSDDQKKVADDLLSRGPFGAGPGMHGHRGGHRGWH